MALSRRQVEHRSRGERISSVGEAQRNWRSTKTVKASFFYAIQCSFFFQPRTTAKTFLFSFIQGCLPYSTTPNCARRQKKKSFQLQVCDYRKIIIKCYFVIFEMHNSSLLVNKLETHRTTHRSRLVAQQVSWACSDSRTWYDDEFSSFVLCSRFHFLLCSFSPSCHRRCSYMKCL